MSEVVFVGTSDAFGAGGRRQSAILVRAPHGGAAARLRRHHRHGPRALGIARDEIDAILISHFHGDHFGGIPRCCSPRSTRTSGASRCASPVRRASSAACASSRPRWATRSTSASWSFAIDFVELPRGPPDRDRPRAGPQLRDPPPAGHASARPGGDRRPGAHRLLGRHRLVRRAAAPRGAAPTSSSASAPTTPPDFEFHLNHEALVAHEPEFDCGRMVLTHLGAEMSERRGKCDFETADDGLRIEV